MLCGSLPVGLRGALNRGFIHSKAGGPGEMAGFKVDSESARTPGSRFGRTTAAQPPLTAESRLVLVAASHDIDDESRALELAHVL